MKALFAVLRRYSHTPTVVFAVLLGTVAGIANTALIVVINRTLGTDAPPDTWKIWLFAGLCLLVPVARIASSTILVSLGASVANTLQIQLSRRILGAPLRRLEEVGPHRLMATLFDDVATVSEVMTFLPNTMINLVVVLGCLAYMGALSVPLLGAVLFTMAIGVFSYSFAMQAGLVRQRRAREVGDQLFAQLRGLTEGTKELKTRRRRREEFMGMLTDAAVGFRGLRVSAQKIFISAASLGNLLFFVVIGVVLYVAPLWTTLPREARNGYVLILLYMSGPLQIVLNTLPVLSQATVGLQKIEHLGLSLLEDEEPQGGEELPAGWDSLELAGVTHVYHRDEEQSFTLGPLDLTFRPGELIFVIGGNGSGKTTLVKLLIGLYLPESGEVRWNGTAVTPETLDSYRQLFSVVFSDFYLFERLLGLDSPDLDARAQQYLMKLRLSHRVRVDGGKLSTIDLSQGQRKRLALLTAFLEDRPVFIFDEWAADQDPEFKEIFYHQILPELRARNKTVFVISHDDRYYHVASRIIKLDYGRVVEDVEVDEPAYGTASPA